MLETVNAETAEGISWLWLQAIDPMRSIRPSGVNPQYMRSMLTIMERMDPSPDPFDSFAASAEHDNR